MAGASSRAVAPAEGGVEPEYESDPDDALRPSAMRRREASDDEEDGGRSEGDGMPAHEDRMTGAIGSDGDSDGEGGAPEEEEEFEEEDENVDEEGVEGGEEELLEEESEVVVYGESEGGHSGGVGRNDAGEGVDSGGDRREWGEERGDYFGKDQVDEKETDPFAVPTAGAFYMHDDRFRENIGGRHSRTKGGRQLWESKDEQKWVHDRFDEMNLQDARSEERTSKSRFRGRGRSRIPNRGSIRGSRYDRSRAYDDGYRSYKNDTSRAYDDSGSQSHARKSVRGRSRQYEPLPKSNSKRPELQDKQSGRSHDVTSNTTTTRQSSRTSNVKAEDAYPQKRVFTSSLNSASPPFYPSGSSNQDTPATLKKDAHTMNNSPILSHSVMDDNHFLSHTGATLRGTAIHDSLRQQGRLYVDDSGLVAGKSLSNLQLPSSSSLPPINTAQSTDFKVQGKGFTATGQVNYQPTSSVAQPGRGSGSGQTQLPAVQRHVQPSIQPVLRVSAEQLGQRPSGGSQISFPSRAQLASSSEAVESESPSGMGKSKMPVVVKGKTSIEESGRGSLMYRGGGSGAMGLAHADQTFPATPALLPVMQFGGQHPGGLGVPAVGMALPGYVAQTQLGFGNSEMTWVPLLAGAAGGLAASYGPYIALDGSYRARPPGQTSSPVMSREMSTTKTGNVLKSSEGSEVANDEFGQRQNKPRRYSEMNFGQ